MPSHKHLVGFECMAFILEIAPQLPNPFKCGSLIDWSKIRFSASDEEEDLEVD